MIRNDTWTLFWWVGGRLRVPCVHNDDVSVTRVHGGSEMGISILTGVEGGGEHPQSVFFCNTKGNAFGPVMPFDADQADEFLTWLNDRDPLFGSPLPDIRRLDPETLMRLMHEYMDEDVQSIARWKQACGHSACVQHYIDTGSRDCIA